MALFIQEIFADTINEKLGVTLKIGQLATDVTNEVAEITTSGDKVHFPKFSRVASVGEVTKGTALVPAEVSMTDNEATIKQTGGSVRIYDKDAKQIKGATLDNMAQQLVDAMALDLDTSLSNTMNAEVTMKSPTGEANTILIGEILDAWALFGDEIDYDTFAGCAVNSRLFPSLMSMEEFVSVEKTYRSDGNGLVKNGLVGYIWGVPVYVTNSGTYDKTANECITYIIKKGALGYVKQKEVELEIEREGKLLCNDIIVSNLFATKVMDTTGIVILRKTIV
jgi:N4-gp56 family major capsid protein